MAQRTAVAIVFAATTFLTLLALAGHNPLSGSRLISLTTNHGLNTGDVIPLGAWAVVAVCCALLWRQDGRR